MADSSNPYAEYGLSGSIVTNADEAYEAEMALKDVRVRDGDDEIIVNSDSIEGFDKDSVLKESTEEESEESTEEESEESTEEESEESTEELDIVVPEDAPKYYEGAKAIHTKQTEAYDVMIAEAISKGAPEDIKDVIEAEMEKGGLSEKTYEALHKVGYSKSFIDAYIEGQQALGEQYVAKVMNAIGGQDTYVRIVKHLQTVNPEAAIALDNAISNGDMTVVKAIAVGAVNSLKIKFGKTPNRDLTKAGVKARPAPAKAPEEITGFTNKAEMVKAMRDKRYGRDAAYTREVELKVFNSKY